MDKDVILGTADLVGLLPHNGAELMYVTDDALIDFANRIHAAGVREGMERAAEICDENARQFAISYDGYQEIGAKRCTEAIRAEAGKE